MARLGPRKSTPKWLLACGFLFSLCAGFSLGIPWDRHPLDTASPPKTEFRMEAGRRFAKVGDHWFAVREEAKPMSFATATSLAAELTQNEAGTFRLPTPSEWEQAARGGIKGATYPWGNQRPTEARMAKPNGYGLLNVAGGLAEWCADRTLRGGSWAEKADIMFTIQKVVTPRKEYAGEDAGLRLLWEPPETSRKANESLLRHENQPR